MTYASREDSVALGEPIELLEFIFPDGSEYRYTTSGADYSALGHTWTSMAISREKLKTNSRQGDQGAVIKAPLNFPPALEFKNQNTQEITMRLYRTHVGDAEVYMQGTWFLGDIVWKEEHVELRGGTLINRLQGVFPRMFYQFQCNHQLYGPECGVTPVVIETSILALGQLVSGVMDFRYVTLNDNIPAAATLSVITVGNESRMITLADGTNTIKIIRAFQIAAVGNDADVYDRGCDRTFATCRDVFSNNDRFGGQPYIPKRNIYQSGV